MLAGCLGIAGCSAEPRCAEKLRDKTHDQLSDRYAITVSRNCGATTDYATVVRVGRTSESLAKAEEIFVADGNHGQATMRDGGAIWIEVGWNGDGQLLVTYASKARVFRRVPFAKQVTIIYRADEPYSTDPLPIVDHYF